FFYHAILIVFLALFLLIMSFLMTTPYKIEKQSWPVGVINLSKLLEENKKKIVIAFFYHQNLRLHSFFGQISFSHMLKINGFTHFLDEAPPEDQQLINQIPSLRPEEVDVNYLDRVDRYRSAAKKGIHVIAVDESLRSTDFDLFDKELGRFQMRVSYIWHDYLLTVPGWRRIYTDGPNFDNERYITDMAAYMRNNHQKLLSTSPAILYRDIWGPRLNDSATANRMILQSQSNKGRAWALWGSWHFTACGLAALVPGSLIIQVFKNRSDYNSSSVKAKNLDVFPTEYLLPPPEVKRVIFLVDEGEVFFKYPSENDLSKNDVLRKECRVAVGLTRP
ncbi:MAG: hypothetical protein ACOYOH_21645, partial [Paracraurococcus sp.]